jgi:hypothetical protein
MTNQEWQKANHDYIQKFLTETADDKSDITGTVKATIAQFLVNIKRQFNLLADANNGVLTKQDLIQSQIDQLRVCVIDLQAVLTTKEGKQ